MPAFHSVPVGFLLTPPALPLPVYQVGCQELCQHLIREGLLPSCIKSPLTPVKTGPLGLPAGQSLTSPGLKASNTLNNQVIQGSRTLEQ